MYHKSKLKNGITLITVPVKGTMATTILAMFPVGSRYENKALSGASHFVEHMLFKGTKRRPEAVDISRTLEAVGAEYNAFTNKDYTGYYVKIDAQKQAIAFDLLSDMIYNSVIEPAEVEKEKGAIVEELRMYIDNPTMAVDLLSDRITFGDNQLGWDIGGTADSVRAITREMLWEYYQKHYSPRNMVLVVAGNVSSAKIKKLTEDFSAQAAPKGALPLNFYAKKFDHFKWPERHVSLEERVAVETRKVDQTQVILNFPALPNNHPDRFALTILLTILGSGMSSRLFVEVREKRGLAYMIRAGSGSFRDVGSWHIQAGLDPKRLKEALTVIRGELEKMTKEPITKRELVDAQNNVAGQLALSMEDSSTQAEWYAKQFLFAKETLTPEEVVRRLKKVTIHDVERLARQLFKWNQLRLAVIGPLMKKDILPLV